MAVMATSLPVAAVGTAARFVDRRMDTSSLSLRRILPPWIVTAAAVAVAALVVSSSPVAMSMRMFQVIPYVPPPSPPPPSPCSWYYFCARHRTLVVEF